jgi:4-amino-4-deoxy-L-arabinose transferase-like glycosyltransferase
MWLQAAAMHVFGPSELAIRLPVFALALVTMAAAFLIGKELSSTWRGLAAAALTGASLSTHVMVVDP